MASNLVIRPDRPQRRIDDLAKPAGPGASRMKAAAARLVRRIGRFALQDDPHALALTCRIGDRDRREQGAMTNLPYKECDNGDRRSFHADHACTAFDQTRFTATSILPLSALE